MTKFGAFVQPRHPYPSDLADVIDESLVEIEWLDQLGFTEVWLGEHLTDTFEPVPAGDLVIAQAIPRTEQIILCSGGFVAPFYHPAALAMRIIQLHHMARGRYKAGFALGGIPTDLTLLNLDASKGEHRELTYESIDIVKRLLTDHVGSEWNLTGKWWTVVNPGPRGSHFAPQLGPHLQPYGGQIPELGIAAISPRSDTMKFAGSRGLLPLSIGMFNASYLADHWAIYAESANEAGVVADRENWRVSREIMVADTDAEARAWARDTFVAELWQSHLLPAMRIAGYLGYIKHDPSVSDEELWTIEYLMDHVWFVGSPDTVLERLRQDQRDSGGYGVVLLHQTDRGSNPERYRHSLELVATELAPKLRAESAVPAGT